MKLKLSMSRVEKISTPIRTQEDLSKIRHPSEQEFARFLLNKNPHLTIYYEPKRFFYKDNQGVMRGTVPDFLIINPKNSGKNIYVEITLAEKYRSPENRTKDARKRKFAIFKRKRENQPTEFKMEQKKIMKQLAPKERYVVLYKENMQNIMRKHPDFNPWNPNKPTIEEKKDLVHTI